MSVRLVLALSALTFLGGCAGSSTFTDRTGDTARSGSCEQRSPEVFVIRGEIDAGLARCVGETLANTTEVLALDTMGGSVEHALDIADLLQNRRLIMRIEGERNSSCANYLLPLARRIEFSPDAMVLLHGSLDPWTIDRFRARRSEFIAMEAAAGRDETTAAANFETFMAKADDVLERQAAFANRHGVKPGWLLYRLPGSGEVAGLAPPIGGGRAVLVEEAMMRSCLPQVEITPYQTRLERHWTRSYRRIGLLWARVVPSGQSRCVDPAPTH